MDAPQGIEPRSPGPKPGVITDIPEGKMKMNFGLVYRMRPFNVITNPGCGLFIFERITGLEPATPDLEGRCSTK